MADRSGISLDDIELPVMVPTGDPDEPLVAMRAKCKKNDRTAEDTQVNGERDRGFEFVCSPAPAQDLTRLKGSLNKLKL